MFWVFQHVPTCVGGRMTTTNAINLRRTLTVNTMMAHGHDNLEHHYMTII